MKQRKKKKQQPKLWLSYEEVAAYLLNRFANEFGLSSVEGKQKVPGLRSDTPWEIDGKGITEDGKGFFIVECRRYTSSKQNQGNAGKLAYSIIDSGAAGGIVVSPLGLQKGAKKIATRENIITVTLTPNSTPAEFAIQFLNKLCLGVSAKATTSAKVSPRYLRQCAKCGEKFEVSVDNVRLPA
jgi:hypothetical protein